MKINCFAINICSVVLAQGTGKFSGISVELCIFFTNISVGSSRCSLEVASSSLLWDFLTCRLLACPCDKLFLFLYFWKKWVADLFSDDGLHNLLSHQGNKELQQCQLFLSTSFDCRWAGSSFEQHGKGEMREAWCAWWGEQLHYSGLGLRNKIHLGLCY